MAGVRISALPVSGALSQSAVTVVVAGGVNYQASLLKLVTGGLPAQAGNANQVLRTDGTNYAWSAGFTVSSAGVVNISPTAGMPASGTALTVKTVNSQTGAAVAVTDPTGATQLVQIGPSSNVTLNSGGRFFTLQATGGLFALTFTSNNYLILDANNSQVLFPSGAGVGVGDGSAGLLTSSYQYTLAIASNNRTLPSAVLISNVTAGVASNSLLLGDVVFAQSASVNGPAVILRGSVDNGTTDTGFFAIYTKATGSGSSGAAERFRITSTGGTILTPSGTGTVGLTIKTVAAQTGEALVVFASDGTTKNMVVMPSGRVGIGVAAPTLPLDVSGNVGGITAQFSGRVQSTGGSFAAMTGGTGYSWPNWTADITSDNTSRTIVVKGNPTDGASAVAVTLKSSSTLANAGAKIFNALNNATEVFAVFAGGGVVVNAAPLTAMLNVRGSGGSGQVYLEHSSNTTYGGGFGFNGSAGEIVSGAVAGEFSFYAKGGPLSFSANNGAGAQLRITTTGLAVAPSAVSTGSPNAALLVTAAAHTALTASVEFTAVNLNLSATQQFGTGALATQRAMRIQAPTYSFVGASTITTASTLSISGAPVAGTNATITNAFALNVESGMANFNADVQVTGNVAIFGGGTLRLVGMGAGRVLFTDSSGNLTSDSGNLFWWDSTNKCLGLGGTPNIAQRLRIVADSTHQAFLVTNVDSTGGQTHFGVSTGSAISGTCEYWNSYKDANGWIFNTAHTGAATTRRVRWAVDDTTVAFVINTDASCGFGGILTPSAKVHVGATSTTQVGLRVDTVAAQSAEALLVFASDGTTKRFAVAPSGALTIITTAQVPVTLTGSASAGTGLDLQNTDTGGVEWILYSCGSAGSIGPAGALVFRDATNGVHPLTLLKSTGLVGVGMGTGSPTARFHVKEATIGNAVQRYESTAASGDNPSRISYQNKVLTTDATATVLHNWALADNTVYCVKARVVARRTGGAAGAAGDSGMWEGTIRARRTSGGGTVLGTVSTQFTEFDQGWAVAFVVNGNGLDLKVTGAVNTSISWILAWSELSPLSS